MTKVEQLNTEIMSLKGNIEKAEKELAILEEEFEKRPTSLIIRSKKIAKEVEISELKKALEELEKELDEIKDKEIEEDEEKGLEEYMEANKDLDPYKNIDKEIQELLEEYDEGLVYDNKCTKDADPIKEIVEKYKDMDYIIDDDCDPEEIKEQLEEFKEDQKTLVDAVLHSVEDAELKKVCLLLEDNIKKFEAIYHDLLKADLVEEIK